MENNKLAPIGAQEIKAQVQIIQEVMKFVMKKDEHYGMIPGTIKDSLYLSGAQKLLSTFRLGSDPEVINIDETQFSVSIRVKVRLFNIADGNTVGFGIGECSSLEDKYAFKKAVSDDEYNSYPEDRRRIKFYASYNVKQVATSYKDIANTILKMAKKRALIDATLTATAAGDIFTQDLEDMEPQTRDSIVNAEYTNSSNTSSAKTVGKNASLQDVRDSVQLLGNKTFTKEEDGKTLLFVAGNCFLVKDTLKEMGFKYRKPQGAQYGETYMDVTDLDSKAPQQEAKAPKQPKSKLTMAQLKVKAEMFGFEISDSKVTENGEWVQAIPADDHSDYASLTRELGFMHLQKKHIYVLNIAA